MAVSRKSKTKDRPGAGKKDDYWQARTDLESQGIHLYIPTIYRDWCKACGLCIAFCPKKVYGRDESGKPVLENPEACIGCRFCETHCPDLAITIEERYPERRRQRNGD